MKPHLSPPCAPFAESSREPFRNLVKVCLFLGVAVIPLPAQEEETPEEEPVFDLSPFTVESRSITGYQAKDLVSVGRLKLTQMETSRAVTVVTGELLEDLKADDLATALKYVPGVDQNSGSWVNTFGDSVSVRGIDAGFTFRNFYRTTTVPWAVTIDRIEVVKGPSALMYGITSPGGQINYLTKRPEFRRGGKVDIQGGSWGLFQSVIDYQDVLLEESAVGDLAYRLIGAYRKNGWYEDHTRQDRWLGLLSVAWRPTTRDTLTLEYEYQENEYVPSLWVPLQDPALEFDGSLTEQFTQQRKGNPILIPFRERTPDQVVRLAGDRHTNLIGPNQVGQRQKELFTADYERRLNADWTFKANALRETGDTDVIESDQSTLDKNLNTFRRAYRTIGTQKLESATALLLGDIEVVEGTWDNRILLGGSWYKDEFTAFRNNTNAFSSRPLWHFDDPLDFVALASVDENELGRDINGDGEIGLIPIPEFQGLTYNEELFPFYHRFTDRRTTFENTAYWVSNDFLLFNKRLILRGGARRDKFEQVGYPSRTATEASEEGEQESDSFQYSAIYLLTESLSIYYSFSESVRDQFVFADGGVAPVVRGEGNEFGLKFSFLEGSVTGAMAYYDLVVDGRVDTSPDGPGFIGLPGETYEGFEIELSAEVFNGLSLIASYAYTDAAQLIPPEDSITGEWIKERVDNVPDHRASIWARYAFQEEFLEGLYIGLGAKYIGDRTYDGTWGPLGGLDASGPGNAWFRATFWQAEYAPRPSYTTVDFLIGLNKEGETFTHDLSLKIDNLLDETYIVSFNKYGEPRSYTVSYKLSF